MMTNDASIIFSTVLAFFVTLWMTDAALAQTENTPRSRSFSFSYGAEILDLKPGDHVAVWLPIAQTNNRQQVELKKTTAPAQVEQHTEPQYGNRIGHVQWKADREPARLQLQYAITRSEAGTAPPAELTNKQTAQFLAPNAKVPVTGRPVELLADRSLSPQPALLGRQLYDLVEDHMRYDKSRPGYGSGDAVWACNSQFGNCTDFHSLYISLMRSQQVPARFEIGFPLPAEQTSGKIGGYHCWAWFHVAGEGWVPVDISEADKHPELKEYYFGHLTPDRVQFTTGRDIELVPASRASPLNYFIYPHVEVNGEVYPKEKVKLTFSFSETDPAQ
ncbi:MAG: transglutaminase domain-containing protein [Mariniblastus sp.]|nr:transglutaminase domain-containing protein [Mariniblastus sp.]